MKTKDVILSAAKDLARAARVARFGQMLRCAQHDPTRFFFYLCSSVFICGSFSGCSGYSGPRSIANPDPAVKIPQIRKAVDAGDKSVIPQLVQDLESSDSAVRFYSINALQRLTGETLGYDWTVADRHRRAQWVAKWHAYLDATTQPAVKP